MEVQATLGDMIKNIKGNLEICEIQTIENSKEVDKLNFMRAVEEAKNFGKNCSGLAYNVTNCKFTRPENHSDCEFLYQNGAEIGLDEVGAESNFAEVIVTDYKLIADGAEELRRQLVDMSFNGGAIRSLLVVGMSAKYFKKTGGFILSNIRYLRAFYCVQKLAVLIQRKYREQFSDTGATVNYTITGVWIGNKKIVEAMKNVVGLTTEIRNNVNYGFNISTPREDIREGIETVAEEEDKVNSGKGSSMALVGYFSLNKNQFGDTFSKCNRNFAQCISYFHINARNDSKFELDEYNL
ncbi:hypothetical protein Mgra_00008095 [Meloidogyne graminicola]|uniref:Uncharacterized protein n=1 Tax=Meloidogyne graminicola TaxID=189291 RepID=A0A8S9ZGQ9_9BILA|nr:hypothetical protein Mgra_00008095 [Meloidogyne graminicola]